jgi:hypothetical protein
MFSKGCFMAQAAVRWRKLKRRFEVGSTKKVYKRLHYNLLLPMNEVYMKFWFSDLKKKVIDFLDELGLFIEEKLVSTKKCPNENFVRTIFERCFQVRDFSFRITEGIGLTGVSFHFWPQKQIPSGSCHRNFWLLFHFQMKYFQFWCFWAWFDVKFFAELKKAYFMGSEMQPGVMRAQKRNLLVMKFF